MSAYMRKSDVIVLLVANLAGPMMTQHGDSPETERKTVDKAMALAGLLREAGVVGNDHDFVDGAQFSGLEPDDADYDAAPVEFTEPEILLGQDNPGPPELPPGELPIPPRALTLAAETGVFTAEGQGLPAAPQPETTPAQGLDAIV